MRNPHQRIIHNTRKMIRRIPIGFQNDEIVSVLVCVYECPRAAVAFWRCGVFRREWGWGEVGVCGWWCWSRGVGAEYQVRWEVNRFRVRLRGSVALDDNRSGRRTLNLTTELSPARFRLPTSSSVKCRHRPS
jgi:hypothetical protein